MFHSNLSDQKHISSKLYLTILAVSLLVRCFTYDQHSCSPTYVEIFTLSGISIVFFIVTLILCSCFSATFRGQRYVNKARFGTYLKLGKFPTACLLHWRILYKISFPLLRRQIERGTFSGSTLISSSVTSSWSSSFRFFLYVLVISPHQAFS